MCLAPTPSPGPVGLAIQHPFVVDLAQLQCDRVRAELMETLRIRAAYADQKFLQEAIRSDLSAQEYNDKVAGSVFPSTGGKATDVSGYDVPMYTDSNTCKIVELWDKKACIRKTGSEIIYLADLLHEQVHQKDCKRDQAQYRADMSFPAKRRLNELKAYDAKIRFLKEWLSNNCAHR